MGNEDISRLPKWAKQRLASQAGTIIELKKQIEELKGEFRTGARILRANGISDDDIPVGDADDRIYFYTRSYDPEKHLDGGRIEAHIDKYDGSLIISAMDSLFVLPTSSNNVRIYDACHDALRTR